MRAKALGAMFLFAGLVGLTVLGPVAAQEKADKKPAHVKIHVPQGDTTLTIEGQPTKQSGTTRLFVSPPLDGGKNYVYKVVALWEPNNYTKITRIFEITFKAGDEVEIDFRKENPKIKDEIKVRYVPTPDVVVEAMCKMGAVTKDDVVYDLGCGDGRIVITAVKKYGAKRGVGVDIDPERVKDSNDNAKKEDVVGKVEFRMQDVLKIDDLPDASVIMLYMGEDLNVALLPTLKKLKPGTRIVSHRFKFDGKWEPEKSEKVTGPAGETYDVHLWRVPEKKE